MGKMVSPEACSLVQSQAGPSRHYGTVEDERQGQETESDAQGSNAVTTNLTCQDCVIVSCIFAALLALNCVTIGFGLPALARKRAAYGNLTVPASSSPLRQFKSYVVVSDVNYCAPIGANVIAKGGSAVDAAIATLLCNGAVHPHAMGIGGGVIFTIYNHTTKTAFIIDGRETAPIGSELFPKDRLSTGALSIAVPGELSAYEKAHSLFGRMPWKQLVQPTIDLCRKGFPVTKELANALANKRNEISSNANLRLAYFNKEKRRIFVEGEIMTCSELAASLELIRDEKAAAFYGGSLGKQLISDLTRQGARLRLMDLFAYKAELREALRKDLLQANVTLYSPPLPGNGAILSLILSILDGYRFSAKNISDVRSASKMFHNIIESLKVGYIAKANLGDQTFLKNQTMLDYIMSTKFAEQIRHSIYNVTHSSECYRVPFDYPPKEERGISHTIVLTSNGDAVAATSSINKKFGSLILSPRTGILLNSHMADFSVEVYGSNAVASGKRPMSSMVPAIFVDIDGTPRLVLGGSGGNRITAGQAQVAIQNLYLGKNVKQAVDAPRLHYEPVHDKVFHEEQFPGVLVDKLCFRGYQVAEDHEPSAINAVSMNSAGIFANLDFRKLGSVAGL
ncbi:glutathione hydrolase 1 proenzyme-like [Varroa destructor]|uniref:Uncharacterized protein n=1 Tax=Varroa destructor TaxID=109461 RepID=A0A7M7JJ76_VARDE|nr:glutathione hydrolase 1 proenzyme-like [Varroa destructor]